MENETKGGKPGKTPYTDRWTAAFAWLTGTNFPGFEKPAPAVAKAESEIKPTATKRATPPPLPADSEYEQVDLSTVELIDAKAPAAPAAHAPAKQEIPFLRADEYNLVVPPPLPARAAEITLSDADFIESRPSPFSRQSGGGGGGGGGGNGRRLTQHQHTDDRASESVLEVDPRLQRKDWHNVDLVTPREMLQKSVYGPTKRNKFVAALLTAAAIVGAIAGMKPNNKMDKAAPDAPTSAVEDPRLADIPAPRVLPTYPLSKELPEGFSVDLRLTKAEWDTVYKNIEAGADDAKAQLDQSIKKNQSHYVGSPDMPLNLARLAPQDWPSASLSGIFATHAAPSALTRMATSVTPGAVPEVQSSSKTNTPLSYNEVAQRVAAVETVELQKPRTEMIDGHAVDVRMSKADAAREAKEIGDQTAAGLQKAGKTVIDNPVLGHKPGF